MRSILVSASRVTKQFIVASTDFILISASFGFGFFISSDLSFSEILTVYNLLWFSTLGIFTFYIFGVYKSVLRFIDLSSIYLMFKSFIVIALSIVILNFILTLYGLSISIIFSKYHGIYLTSENWILIGLLSLISVVGIRLLANYLLSEAKSTTRVAIYGAGSAGIQLANALRVSSEIQPVVFVDKNPSIQGTFLGGIKVLHPKKLKKLSLKGKIDEVLIAVPSASKSTLRALLKEVENLSLKVRILPGLAELAQGKILVSELKEVDISDLLGRYEVEANQHLINKNIENKVVLITGAGGSIGSEISRQVAKNQALKIILLDANEYALYSIKQELEGYKINLEIHAVLASVNNKKRMTEVCKIFKVDTIYHTAAYKHVPLVEANPFEAVFNNIQGTKTCAEAAIEAEVETFVLISTDKAVRPTNIMGATKRFSELILQSLAKNSPTRMTMVRFGNVIGSSGSAIPLFQEQIKAGGPVTVTHPDVIRYFMSIPEAAELVIQAGAMGKGGDVFVLDMGEPVNIYELAKRLIKLSGMEVKDEDNPEGEIEIIFTGLRPGEKLYEELLIGDKVSTTEHKQILRAEEDFLEASKLEKYLHSLNEAEQQGDVNALKEILKEVVSGFTPSNEIVDIVYQQKN